MIPRTLAQIWIGELDPPREWMETWRELNPDWAYILIDNDYILSRKWRCAPQILHYLKRGLYAGVADLIRYEYLYDNGGVMMASDSICLRPLDELFAHDQRLQADLLLATVHAAPQVEDRKVSPYFAASKGHPLLDRLLGELEVIAIDALEAPFKSTGNWKLRDFHEAGGYEQSGEVVVLHKKTLIPTQPQIFRNALRGDIEGRAYEDVLAEEILRVVREGEAFAFQYWGSTLKLYEEFNEHVPRAERKLRKQALIAAFQEQNGL